MNRLKNESGQALFLVMMVLMVMMLIGAAALTRTSGSRIRSFEQKKIVQSSYIAEAGVEKVLANIKNNYEWLKNMEPNHVTNYVFAENGLASLDYAGGQISNVKITRTSTGDNPMAFYIESQGDYQGATRTIKVTGEMYDPIDFSKGIWVNGGASSFSPNTTYNTDITSQGSLNFQNNVNFTGNIIAAGSVTFSNNAVANNIVSGGDVIIYNNVTAANVKAGRDVDIRNNAVITGNVYYNRTLTPQPLPAGMIMGSVIYGWDTSSVINNIPDFPLLDESIYSQNPDRTLSETLSGSFNANGISYAPGDLTITNDVTYTGNGIIVTHGKVTIDGDLVRPTNDNLSSLAIISFGNVNGIGIEALNNYNVQALLYSPNIINLNNNTVFKGSVVCSNVKIDNNGTINYDPVLNANIPKWMTTVVKIKSWKESYPVF